MQGQIVITQTRVLNPLSPDEPMDNGPQALFNKRVVRSGKNTTIVYDLIYPTSNEDQIVGRLGASEAVIVQCKGEPTDALPKGSSVYSVDWKGSSIIASVCDRKEIGAFLQGLMEQVITPEIAAEAKMKRLQCLICLALFVFLFIIGIFIFFCIQEL